MTWFFFFKQKTAYEMRTSDWSSDVCSSDLQRSRVQAWPGDRTPCRRPGARNRKGRARPDAGRAQDSGLNEKGEKGMIMLRIGLASAIAMAAAMAGGSAQARPAAAQSPPGYTMPATQTWDMTADRSEEHTSELQSLMRISSAVFSLKKKNQHTQHTT